MADFLLDEYSIHSWIINNNIKTERGDPLTFKDHPFLFDVYSDMSPLLVCYKAAQIGFSTLANIKALWASRYKHLEIIYTLPTETDVRVFVGGKTNRLIAQNPVLSDWTKDKDSVEQKQIGNSMIYFRGTFTEKAAIMIPADLLIHDEIDSSKQDIIAAYESRLQASKYRWRWVFSHPSVDGNGVSKYWNQSDQKHWFVKCSHCSKRQFLEWPDSIDMKRGIYICKFCFKEITDDDRRQGEWVAKEAGKAWSGYWIPALICPWIPATKIIEQSQSKTKEYFFNKVLGLPYTVNGAIVTPDVIYRNCIPDINPRDNVVIGCDSGLIKHYVIGNDKGLFYYGKTEDWEDIEGLLRKFPRSIAVIDALPDLTEPRKLRDKYPGRVYLAFFSRDRKTMGYFRWGKDADIGTVQIDRNRTIQMVVDEFADMRIPLEGIPDDWAEFVSHWKTMYRRTEDDALGCPQLIWESTSGVDHWVMSTCYYRAGMDKKLSGTGGQLITGEKKERTSPTIINDTMKVTGLRPKFYDETDNWRNNG